MRLISIAVLLLFVLGCSSEVTVIDAAKAKPKADAAKKAE